MHDVLIIGKGPAGISAALYAARAGLKILVAGKNIGALEKARAIENYYGMEKTVSGAELAERGINQIKNLGVEIIETEVTGVNLEENFITETTAGEIFSKTVILATGAARESPPIQNLSIFEGNGVSHCAVCDAFFFRGKDVAVLGAGAYALREAEALLPLVNSVSVLTNGGEPAASFPQKIVLIKNKISLLEGENKLEKICFEDGGELEIAGLFVAVGVAGSAELARKIGAEIENGYVSVNSRQETSVPGLYAAGDCTGGMKQIVKAAYEGAVAGTEVVKFINSSK